MNLAVNARDAMPGGGKLVLETKRVQVKEADLTAQPDLSPGPHVLINVSDTGCAMSKEVLEHIFEPFFTTKEPDKGTGLGLATVYGIVKQSRGHKSVNSELGKATTFAIFLPPLARPQSAQQPLASVSAPRGKALVLLVEDEPALLGLASQSLKKLGYTVLQAANGLEAIAVADGYSGRIDIVVTDVVMPRRGDPNW